MALLSFLEVVMELVECVISSQEDVYSLFVQLNRPSLPLHKLQVLFEFVDVSQKDMCVFLLFVFVLKPLSTEIKIRL